MIAPSGLAPAPAIPLRFAVPPTPPQTTIVRPRPAPVARLSRRSVQLRRTTATAARTRLLRVPTLPPRAPVRLRAAPPPLPRHAVAAAPAAAQGAAVAAPRTAVVAEVGTKLLRSYG